MTWLLRGRYAGTCTDHVADHALTMKLIIHWSRDCACTHHGADHTLIRWLIMHSSRHYWDKTSLGTLPSAPWIVRLSNLFGEKRNYSWPCVSTRDYSFWSFGMVLSLNSSNFHICMGWSPLFLENMVSYIISLFQVEWQIQSLSIHFDRSKTNFFVCEKLIFK